MIIIPFFAYNHVYFVHDQMNYLFSNPKNRPCIDQEKVRVGHRHKVINHDAGGTRKSPTAASDVVGDAAIRRCWQRIRVAQSDWGEVECGAVVQKGERDVASLGPLTMRASIHYWGPVAIVLSERWNSEINLSVPGRCVFLSERSEVKLAMGFRAVGTGMGAKSATD